MQRPSTPKVKIPDPCHEKWELMSPTEKGRFCQSCSKEVTDFSRMTDAELMHYLSQPRPEGTCGNFRDDQVIVNEKPLTWFRNWTYYLRYAAVSLLALLSTKQAMAQTEASILDAQDDHKIPVSINNERTDSVVYLFQGHVHNAKTGNPIRFAAISVEKSNGDVIQVGSTDDNGDYRVEVGDITSDEAFKVILRKTNFKDLVLHEYHPGVTPEQLEMKSGSTSYGSNSYAKRNRRYRRHHRGRYAVRGKF